MTPNDAHAKQHLVFVFCFLSFIVGHAAAQNTVQNMYVPPDGNSITGSVLAFYAAINTHRCDEAIRLRPGYTIEQCKKIDRVTDIEVTPVSINMANDGAEKIVTKLKVRTQKNGEIIPWHGYLMLVKKNGQYQIVNDSYTSIDDDTNSEVSSPLVTMSTSEKSSATINQIDGQNDEIISDKMNQVAPTVSALKSEKTSLLNQCWTPKELRDSDQERQIKNHQTPDHSPPFGFDELALKNKQPAPQIAARSIRAVVPAQGEKIIALTFDLCEQADEKTGYDGALVDLLRDEKVHATFYAGGKWMRSHPERTMQLMADPLFEIGNHAWTHGNLRVLRGSEIDEQINWAQWQYHLLRTELSNRPCASAQNVQTEQIPVLPKTFRFPYGTCDQIALEKVANAGLYPVQWDIVTGDPSQKQSAKAIVNAVLKQVHSGAIVIAHGNGRGWHTFEAFKTLIPELRKRGYEFVTVTQLLNSGRPVAVESCYEVKPNDNLRYDKLFGRGTE